MAATRTGALSMSIVWLTMQLLWTGGSRAQSPDCSSVLTSMAPCLTYVTDKSSTPDEKCCTQLKDVVHSSPLCLCQVINGSFGVAGINRTRALELPAACNVPTPPASSCNAAASSPGGSPVPDTPSSPEGSGNAPETGKSDGSSIKASSSLLLFFIIIAASYCSSASMTY